MVKSFCFRVLLPISLICLCGTVLAETKTTSVITDIGALTAYEEGFAYDVMRASDNQGVMLNNMVLIEDDAPGSGYSEKGTWTEEIYQGILAKKTFLLDDPSAFEAHLVFYLISKNANKKEQKPFFFFFNGMRIEGPPLSWHENMWHWLKVPVDALQKGENTVILGCDAPQGEGYELMLARADEYEAGGGMYSIDGSTALHSAGQIEVDIDEKSGKFRFITIGKNSAKSTDGGKTWIQMKLGKTNDVVGEYTIRVNLKRYKPEGSLLSSPIDLWDGIQGYRKIKPECTVSDLKLYCLGDTPKGTSIIWQVRLADTTDMMSKEWGEFMTVGTGQNLTVSLGDAKKRYIQWKALLSTKDPLMTPAVYDVKVRRILTYTPVICVEI